MAASTFITPHVTQRSDAVFGKYPLVFFGQGALNVSNEPWKSKAPQGSLYVKLNPGGTAQLYFRSGDTGSGDWDEITGTTAPQGAPAPRRKSARKAK